LAGLADLGISRHPEAAARLLGAAETFELTSGGPGSQSIVTSRTATFEALRRALGADNFAAAFEAGRLLTGDEAVAEAESLAAMVQSAESTAAVSQRPEATGKLSKRELEVVRLVADGKTDAEIADDLFIARRTVTSHLTSIFTKLGVDNRAAAAAYAIRHDLI
jgi:DNA-binding NarL/FixJ family response regulator